MALQTEGQKLTKCYRGNGQRWENPDSVKNQSDCLILNRARLEKIRRVIWTVMHVTSYGKSLF